MLHGYQTEDERAYACNRCQSNFYEHDLEDGLCSDCVDYLDSLDDYSDDYYSN